MRTLRNILIISYINVVIVSLGVAQTNNSEMPKVGFFGYKFGASLPAYSVNNDEYVFSTEFNNFGFMGGVEFGHNISSKFILSFNPFLQYSNYGKKSYSREIKGPDNTIYEQYSGAINYNHLSLLLPVVCEYAISKKFKSGAGFFIMKQLIGSEYRNSEGVKHYYFDVDERKYFKYLSPKLVGFKESYSNNPSDMIFIGLNLNMSIRIKTGNHNTSFLNIEYFSSFVNHSQFKISEKWITLSYNKRIYN